MASESDENMPERFYNILSGDSAVLEALLDIKTEVRDMRMETRDMRMETRDKRMEARDMRMEARDMRMEARDMHMVMLNHVDGTVLLNVPDEFIDLALKAFSDGKRISKLPNSEYSKVVKFKRNNDCDPILPMSEGYNKAFMYVRESYPEYYEYVKRIFKTPSEIKYISITGSPGIGKSMLYNWFFNKYRSENTNTIIVCASFSRDRVMQRCVVFEPGKVPVEHTKRIPTIIGAMYLYDGPPMSLAPAGKMVAFISPNDDWLKFINKCPMHVKLVMPVWTLVDLIDADTCLGLNIGEEELEARYDIFGGVPRDCFESNDFTVSSQESLEIEIRDSVHNLAAIDENYVKRTTDLCHRIIHYIPKKVKSSTQGWPCLLPRSQTMTHCSEYVLKQLKRHWSNANQAERIHFVGILRGDPFLASALGFVYEGYCNLFFVYRIIEEPKKFWGHKATSCSGTDTLKLEMSPAVYSPSPDMHWDAIDGHSYSSKKGGFLNLFQATMQARHCINTNGIVKHIYWMEDEGADNLAERIIKKDIKLRFIFLIPEGSAAYANQIKTQYTGLKSTPFAAFGRFDPITHECKLRNIRTLDALSDAVESFPAKIDSELLPGCKLGIKRFRKRSIETPKLNEIIQEMPQFYFHVPGSSIYKK